jgi:hypothetical protein
LIPSHPDTQSQKILTMSLREEDIAFAAYQAQISPGIVETT